MISRIKNWYSTNNGHPLDDQMLYDIVIDTLDSKLEEDIFSQAIENEDDSSNAYKRYEDLRECLLYYINKDVIFLKR